MHNYSGSCLSAWPGSPRGVRCRKTAPPDRRPTVWRPPDRVPPQNADSRGATRRGTDRGAGAPPLNAGGRDCARVVLQAMPCFQRKVSPEGRAPRAFCKRRGVFKGIPHFASVTTLAKCGSAVKTWYRCGNWTRRTRTAVETAHSGGFPGSDAHGTGGTAVKTPPVAPAPRAGPHGRPGLAGISPRRARTAPSRPQQVALGQVSCTGAG